MTKEELLPPVDLLCVVAGVMARAEVKGEGSGGKGEAVGLLKKAVVAGAEC